MEPDLVASLLRTLFDPAQPRDARRTAAEALIDLPSLLLSEHEAVLSARRVLEEQEDADLEMCERPVYRTSLPVTPVQLGHTRRLMEDAFNGVPEVLAEPLLVNAPPSEILLRTATARPCRDPGPDDWVSIVWTSVNAGQRAMGLAAEHGPAAWAVMRRTAVEHRAVLAGVPPLLARALCPVLGTPARRQEFDGLARAADLALARLPWQLPCKSLFRAAATAARAAVDREAAAREVVNANLLAGAHVLAGVRVLGFGTWVDLNEHRTLESYRAAYEAGGIWFEAALEALIEGVNPGVEDGPAVRRGEFLARSAAGLLDR